MLEDDSSTRELGSIDQTGGKTGGGIRSLRELLDTVSGKGLPLPRADEDAGLAEALPFPFLAIVGQQEMKLALLLALINPAVGGVLLVGPRGTGKTTAARALADLLPEVPRSLCYYGCLEEDIEAGGMDAVCPECAKKYGQAEPLSRLARAHLIELPLNSRLDDVIGWMEERSIANERQRLRRGILSIADRNILYVDEVNLLADEVVDAILDAAAQGTFTVRRGQVSATYRSRFVLIGSMNPEEGDLRPQILDRFGLRVMVRGLEIPAERMEAYRRVRSYRMNPHSLMNTFAEETALLQDEIRSARRLVTTVEIPEDVVTQGLSLINRLHIHSLRAEITLFEAARAHAAADGRALCNPADLEAVAPMALRMRRSTFIHDFFAAQQQEELEITNALHEQTTPEGSST